MRAAFLALCAVPLLSVSVEAFADRVPCPVVVDRETGEFSSAKAKYRCYDDSRSARRSGFSKHSFNDDNSCGGGGGGGGAPSLSLTGPGERRSVVFTATSGGSIDYVFPGGGEFEIKVFNASSERRVEQVFETSSASSGTATFAAQAAPVYIKVEGPGAWTATVRLP